MRIRLYSNSPDTQGTEEFSSTQDLCRTIQLCAVVFTQEKDEERETLAKVGAFFKPGKV